MFDRMLRSAFALVIAAGLVPALPATASAQETPQQPQEQTDSIADEELERFARAYLEIARLTAQMERDTALATSPEEKQEIVRQTRAAMPGVLQEHEITAQRYREIANLLNQDPELRQKFAALLEEIQGA